MGKKIVINESTLRKIVRRVILESSGNGKIVVNGSDFVERALGDVLSDDLYAAAQNDEAIQEISMNEFTVWCNAWSEPQTYWDPGNEGQEITDDDGLYDLIENIADENLRNAFFKAYEKYVEEAEFDFYDDYDPDYENERRRERHRERDF